MEGSVPGWVPRLNALAMRLRDRWRALFPYRLDPLFIRAVALETTTACTRRCPYCPPHSAMDIPRLEMPRELFTRVVSSLGARGYAGDIFFSLYGDSLCDPRLESLVAEAREKVKKARLVVFTNGDLLTEERYRALRRAGMDEMSLSKHSAELSPGLAGALERLGLAEGPDFRVHVVDYYAAALPGAETGLLNNKGGLAPVRRPPLRSCCDVESACVDCLGKVLLCNNDATSSYVFGDANEKDFWAVWEDPVFVRARRDILRGRWPFEICRRCMSAAGAVTPVPSGPAARLPAAFPGAAEEIKRFGRGGG